MSSPGHRRQRSSQSATPRRSSQRNAIPSSPPDAAAAQLQNEAASSQGQVNGTPRRAAPSSSPMIYRSSPADIARSNRERDVSSPLRQMTNSQPTQEDGDRTPRASGLLGGKILLIIFEVILIVRRVFTNPIRFKLQPWRGSPTISSSPRQHP
jgi:DNA replication licensing factor MCM4